MVRDVVVDALVPMTSCRMRTLNEVVGVRRSICCALNDDVTSKFGVVRSILVVLFFWRTCAVNIDMHYYRSGRFSELIFA
jgi:hypothetical protein